MKVGPKTIFDYISSVLFTKDASIMQTVDDEQIFSPFMMNRWCSMYSPEVALIVNETTNKYSRLFPTKLEMFKYYCSIYPKYRFKRINYIKKKTESKTKTEEDNTEMIAAAAELSQREIQMYNQLTKELNIK